MATATFDRPAVDHPAPRRRGRRAALVVGCVAVLGVEVALAAPYLGTAVTAVTQATDGWVALAVLASAASLTAFALTRRRLLAAAGVAASARSTLAAVLVANAFHMTLPAGVAFSTGHAARWMGRRGAGPAVAGWNLAVHGLLSTATLTALGVVASLSVGTASWARFAVEIALTALLVAGVGHLVRRPERVLAVARRALAAVNRLRRRPADAGADRLAATAAQLRAVRPSARDWTAATVHALLNWLFDVACLAACAHAVGVSGVGTLALLAAYVAGSAASSLSLLPGGLGTVDATLVVGLVAGGAPATAALSAVVLYRLISLAGVVAAGWVVRAVQTAEVRQVPSVTRY